MYLSLHCTTFKHTDLGDTSTTDMYILLLCTVCVDIYSIVLLLQKEKLLLLLLLLFLLLLLIAAYMARTVRLFTSLLRTLSAAAATAVPA
jgi:hypothetical protein